MPFKKFNLIVKNNLKEKSIKYLKNNPCCKYFPNCTHPHFQSDPNLWNNSNFYYINKQIFSIIFDHYKKVLKIDCKMWVYLQNKNSILKEYQWHNHSEGEAKDQLSFLIYLTKTEIGTLFKINNKIFELKPEINTLYLWDSKYEHTPKIGKHPKDRVVLAGACFINI